jgi:hypothetical protein
VKLVAKANVGERRAGVDESFSAFDHSHPRHTPAPTFGDVKKHRVGTGAVVKPRPTTLIGWILSNPTFADATITFCDLARAATQADEVDWPLTIAPGENAVAEFKMQIPFFHGLAYRVEGELRGVLLYS